MSLEPVNGSSAPVFDETLRLLESRGCEIVDMSRDQSFIETRRVLYANVEDTSWNIGRVYVQFLRTMSLTSILRFMDPSAR